MENVGVAFIAQGGDQYIITLNQATKATNTFVDATDKGSGKVSAAGQVIIGGLRQMGSIAVDVFAKAAKATAAFVGDSVNLAGDFQAGMKQFQVAAGKDIDAKGLEKFHDLFLQLGKDLPVSTSEVEQAAIELVKGGIDPATVAAGGLKQAIQFAGAAMKGDLAGAAEVSAKIVAGWADVNATAADKANLLTHATDLFTKAANASSTDVEQLSRGIFNAQGIAKTAGVSLDDLTTTIAELSGDFSSSSEAGTSLKNMIARLQPTTDPATEAMKALGLYTDEAGSAFYDAQGNFVGFQTASQLLQDSLKGLTKEQQAAALQTIFGNDAMSAASGLAARGADGYQVMAESLSNAMGVAEAGATIQSGYNIALENAKGSVEAFQIQLGEHLLPILTALLDNVITPGINTLSTFADAIFGSDEAFNQLSPSLQSVAMGIGVLFSDVQEIVGAFNEAGAGTADFAQRIGDLASDLGLPGDLITDIVRATQELIGTFNSAGGASDTLGAVLSDLSGIFGTVLTTVQDVADGYMAIAQSVLPIVTKLWADHGTQISAFVKTTYDSVISIVRLALELYDSIVPPVLNAIAGFFEAHGSEIEKILSGAGQAIGAIVTGFMDTVKGIFQLALDLIHGDWEAAWSDIEGIASTQATAIGGAITGFLNMIAGLFDTSLAKIGKTWQDNWDMLVEIAMKVGDRMLDAGEHIVAGIVQGIEDNAGAIYDALKEIADKAVHAFLHAIGAESPAKEFMPAGQYVVMGIMEGVNQMIPSLTDLVAGMGDDLIKQVSNIASAVQDAIGDAFGATASIDRQMASNLDKLSKMSDDFYKTATENALRSAAEQAKAFADPAVGAKYYQMRSRQIFEFQDLQEKINAATDADTKASLQQQQILILKAQEAEQQAFDATNSRTKSAIGDLITEIGLLFNNPHLQDLQKQYAEAKTDAERARIQQQINEASIPINDTGLGHDLMELLRQLEIQAGIYTPPPGLAGGGFAEKGQPYWVGEDGPELFWPGVNGTVMPAATSAQLAAQSRSTTYNGQVGNSYSMPIYTNQSPSVIQQSLAIAAASMP